MNPHGTPTGIEARRIVGYLDPLAALGDPGEAFTPRVVIVEADRLHPAGERPLPWGQLVFFPFSDKNGGEIFAPLRVMDKIDTLGSYSYTLSYLSGANQSRLPSLPGVENGLCPSDRLLVAESTDLSWQTVDVHANDLISIFDARTGERVFSGAPPLDGRGLLRGGEHSDLHQGGTAVWFSAHRRAAPTVLLPRAGGHERVTHRGTLREAMQRLRFSLD